MSTVEPIVIIFVRIKTTKCIKQQKRDEPNNKLILQKTGAVDTQQKKLYLH